MINTIISNEYNGYHYEVRLCYAHHCGYVRLPKDHKYYNEVTYKSYDDINDDLDKSHYGVHGGLTYLNDESDGRYIGWDYAHCNDMDDHDVALSEAKLIGNKSLIEYNERVIKLKESDPSYAIVPRNFRFYTKEDVEDECKEFIDQLIDVNKKSDYIDAEIID